MRHERGRSRAVGLKKLRVQEPPSFQGHRRIRCRRLAKAQRTSVIGYDAGVAGESAVAGRGIINGTVAIVVFAVDEVECARVYELRIGAFEGRVAAVRLISSIAVYWFRARGCDRMETIIGRRNVTIGTAAVAAARTAWIV